MGAVASPAGPVRTGPEIVEVAGAWRPNRAKTSPTVMVSMPITSGDGSADPGDRVHGDRRIEVHAVEREGDAIADGGEHDRRARLGRQVADLDRGRGVAREDVADLESEAARAAVGVGRPETTGLDRDDVTDDHLASRRRHVAERRDGAVALRHHRVRAGRQRSSGEKGADHAAGRCEASSSDRAGS